MAVPEWVTPVYNNIIVSVYNGAGFGIRGTNPRAIVGTVYKIGANVYNVSVNSKIGFLKTEAFFATDLDEDFTVIDKADVLITYYEIPS